MLREGYELRSWGTMTDGNREMASRRQELRWPRREYTLPRVLNAGLMEPSVGWAPPADWPQLYWSDLVRTLLEARYLILRILIPVPEG